MDVLVFQTGEDLIERAAVRLHRVLVAVRTRSADLRDAAPSARCKTDHQARADGPATAVAAQTRAAPWRSVALARAGQKQAPNLVRANVRFAPPSRRQLEFQTASAKAGLPQKPRARER